MCVALLQLPGVKTKPFSDEYDLKEELGIGTYSICKKCVHKVNGQEFAVKVHFIRLLVHNNNNSIIIYKIINVNPEIP